jgi:hypothetical protein
VDTATLALLSARHEAAPVSDGEAVQNGGRCLRRSEHAHDVVRIVRGIASDAEVARENGLIEETRPPLEGRLAALEPAVDAHGTRQQERGRARIGRLARERGRVDALGNPDLLS